jgi:hypothetical protein
MEAKQKVAVPDFQTLILPVLKPARTNEVRLGDLVEHLGADFYLTNDPGPWVRIPPPPPISKGAAACSRHRIVKTGRSIRTREDARNSSKH